MMSLRSREQGRVLLTVASVAAGIAVIGGAAFWGYRAQTLAWPTPTASASASSLDPNVSPGPPARVVAAQQMAGAVRRAATDVTTGAQAGSGGATQSEALKWPIWEFLLRQPIPARNPPLTPVPWRLIGAAQSAGTWSIIVMRQGKSAPEYFKTGESLPGGYRIESITEEDVTLVQGKRPVTLSYIGSR